MEQELDFKVNIQHQKLDEHIEPDTDISVDKYDSLYMSNTHEESDNQELIIQEYDLREAAHPIVCILTICIQSAPCIAFLLMNAHIITYSVVLTLQLAGFLYIKNIGGSELVGLRWWNEIKMDGSDKWLFKSHDSADKSNKVDSAFFWTALSWPSAFWLIVLMGHFLTLSILWISLSGLCCLMNVGNLYGFYRCRSEHKKKLNHLQKEMSKKGLNIVGMMLK